MSFVALEWKRGVPLVFYIKMNGGVPGLEDKSVDDNIAWNYSVAMGRYKTDYCEFVEVCKERLYCRIEIPDGYSRSAQPMTLTVNGCDAPIHHDKFAEIPMMKPGPSSGGSACDTAPLCGAPVRR